MNMVKLAYEEFGDNSKPVLIILHGFFASSRNWRQMAKRFAAHFHVYVLDMRNHGLSPHHPEMNYPVMTDDLNAFLDQHNLQSASFLGHSMGGKVGMWFALNYPERTQKLIVADISPVSYQHSFNQTINALQQLPLSEIRNRKQAEEFLATDIPELSYRQFLLQNLQLVDGRYEWRINLDVFYHSADNIIAFPDTVTISPYPSEVLFLMGGNSTYCDKDAIKTCFPNASIMALENTSHWLHIDAPEQFLDHCIKFLQNK